MVVQPTAPPNMATIETCGGLQAREPRSKVEALSRARQMSETMSTQPTAPPNRVTHGSLKFIPTRSTEFIIPVFGVCVMRVVWVVCA